MVACVSLYSNRKNVLWFSHDLFRLLNSNFKLNPIRWPQLSNIHFFSHTFISWCEKKAYWRNSLVSCDAFTISMIMVQIRKRRPFQNQYYYLALAHVSILKLYASFIFDDIPTHLQLSTQFSVFTFNSFFFICYSMYILMISRLTLETVYSTTEWKKSKNHETN